MDSARSKPAPVKGDESGDESWEIQPKTLQDEENESDVQPQQILDRIRAEKLDFSRPDSDAIEKFYGDYQSFFKKEQGRKQLPHPGNILHIFAKESSPAENKQVGSYWTDKKISDFLQWLLKSHWPLLETKSKSNQHYPLHTALEAKNNAFIQAVLDFQNLPNLDSVLYKQRHSEFNYIELAVKQESPMLEAIARRCAQEDQMWASSNGKRIDTPLHAAVTRICYMEKYLVDTLLSKPKGRRYLKTIAEVYKKWKEKHAHGQDVKGETRASKIKSNTPDLSDTAAETGKGEPIGPLRVSRRDVARLVVDLIHDYQRSREPLSQVKTVELFVGLSKDFNALECKVKKGKEGVLRTPYQERIAKLEEVWGKVIQAVEKDNLQLFEDPRSRMTDEDAKRMIVTEDPVAETMRYHCLRYFDRDRIERCLYQPGNERNIDFDLAGLRSPSISRAFLTRLAKHLRFESILKYVALPKLALEDQHGFEGNEKDLDESQPSNRKDLPDLRAVFQWLRENNVKRILRVTVIDYGTPCHSDTAIEEALNGFQVETWDWKKVDLCTDVIANSTSVARHISLYSSGKNAVLMGWASSDGLGDRRKFPKLESVRLFIAKGQEGDKRQKYIEAFENKVRAIGTKNPENDQSHQQTDKCAKESSGSVTVEHHLDDGKVSYAADFKNDEIPQQQEVDWISQIKTFSTFMSNIPRREREKIAPIKIAIIDDGVDTSLDFLVGKIGGGKSFCPYASSSDLMNAYYVPSGRHGTMMADLICRICPSCQLYVARLDERPSRSDSGRQITIESAAQAVKWATDCHVNIISMSWTLEISSADRKETEISELHAAIQAASAAGILMFCATSDQGSIATDNCYPGKWDECISVGAATTMGDKCTWVPEQYQYLFPGKNIPFRWNRHDDVSSWYESGSSLATALATGLSGLIVYCARAVGQPISHDTDPKVKIKEMLNRLSQLSRSLKFPRADVWFGEKFLLQVGKASVRAASDQRGSISGRDIPKLKQTDFLEMQWTDITKEALKNLLQDMMERG